MLANLLQQTGKLTILLILLSSLTALCGCLGPATIQTTRSQYNHAVRKTDDEELLLNLVRLRYGENLRFLPLSGLNAQFEFTTSGEFGEQEKSRQLLGRIGFSDRPTLTFAPQRSSEFTKALLGRIPLDSVYLFSHLGWDLDAVLRLYVRNINGIENAGSGGGPMPKYAPEFEEFRTLAALLESLADKRSTVLDIKHLEKEVADVRFAKITPEDLATLKKAGYGVRSAKDGKGFVATESTPVTVLSIHPQALTSPEMMHITRVLRLTPMQTRYEVQASPADQLAPLSPFDKTNTIKITTRSIFEVMSLLAKGVEVPKAHIKKGIAEITLNADGSYFDWGQVLGDLFNVQVCKLRPRRAAVAVRYRGYWFYISDIDHKSKTTLSLFNELLRLQRVGAAEGQPVLTLPVGS